MLLNGKEYTKEFLEELINDVENIAENLDIDIQSFNFEEESTDIESYQNFADKYKNLNSK